VTYFLSLFDGVIGLNLTDGSRNLTLVSPAGMKEPTIKLSTDTILDARINSDAEGVMQGSFPNTTLITPYPGTRDENPIEYTSTKDEEQKAPLPDVGATTNSDGVLRTKDIGDRILHDTTAATDTEDVSAVQGFSSGTLHKQMGSKEVSSGQNVSFINETQFDDEDKLNRLLFNIDRMPDNVSYSNSSDIVDNRKINCSMINTMVVIFTLGRNMPFSIDIICLVIGCVGIIGNLATVVVVATNLKLRKSYFLTILTLAIADLFGISFKMGTIFLEYEFVMYMTCLKPSFYFVTSTFLSFEINAVLQVVLIALVKFLLLVCPINSKLYLTNNVIVVLFFAIWIVSASSSFFVGYLFMQRVEANENTTIVMVGFLGAVFIPSNLLIIILHFIKVIKLSKSQALQKEVQKMNKVVTIILGIFFVNTFAKLCSLIVFRLTENVAVLEYFHQCISVVGFVHHASNPLIYVAFTPLVQKPWQRLKERFRER
jgi:hypothetical protein